jgi:hypothetical protein
MTEECERTNYHYCVANCHLAARRRAAHSINIEAKIIGEPCVFAESFFTSETEFEMNTKQAQVPMTLSEAEGIRPKRENPNAGRFLVHCPIGPMESCNANCYCDY